MKLLVYSVLMVTLIIAILYMSFYIFTEPYTLPTALAAIEIIKYGKLFTDAMIYDKFGGGYWAENLKVELYYPLPSILIAIFGIILGLPLESIAFLPIGGAGILIFYVLARKILINNEETLYIPSSLSLILVQLYFMFIVFDNLRIIYYGRAATGVLLTAFFVYSYTLALYTCVTRNRYCSSWFMISIIFALASGLTYYISGLASIIISLVGAAIAIMILLRFRLHKRSIGYGKVSLSPMVLVFIMSMSIFISSSYIFLWNYFVEIVDVHSILNRFSDFIANIFTFNFFSLKGRIAGGNVSLIYDTLTLFLRVFVSLIRITALIVIIILTPISIWDLLQGRIGHTRIYTITVAGLVMSEILVYGGVSGRFPTQYGLVLYIKMFLNISRYIKKRHELISKFILIIIALQLILSSWGMMRLTYHYSWDPLGYYKVRYVAEWITLRSESVISITGDIHQIGQVLLYASLIQNRVKILPEPLRQDADTLSYALQNKDLKEFSERMLARNIRFLLLTKGTFLIFGYATWFSASPILCFECGMTILRNYTNILYSGVSILFEVLS